MARDKLLRQFPKIETDKLMYELDRSGKAYTIESEFPGTGYAVMQDTLVCIGGKNGMLSIDLTQARKFCKEVLSVLEILEARDEAGIRR